MFYHIFTSHKNLNQPIKVKIKSTILQSFKEFIKDKQNDGSVKTLKAEKELVLLPKYKASLKSTEFYLPQTLLPIFSNDESSEIKTYSCEINTNVEKRSDIEDLTYYFDCSLSISALDQLVSSRGESENIMKIIIHEILNYHIFNAYSDSNSIVVINSGTMLKFNRRIFSQLLRQMLAKWEEAQESIYHSDQFVSVCKKVLAIMGSLDAPGEESPKSQKKCQSLGDSECLSVKITLASKRDRSKVQEYKVIDSIDQAQIGDNIHIEFKSLKDNKTSQDIQFESTLFKSLYEEEVIEPIHDHYQNLLSEKSVDRNYMMLYGQKATGKTFFVLSILPKLFPQVDIQYIDMNRMLLLSNNFSDMDAAIKYLSSVFLAYSDNQNQRLFIIDHLD